MKKSGNESFNVNSKGRIIRFLEKRGFYIVLLVCIIVIGVTAALVTKTNMEYLSNTGMMKGSLTEENHTEDTDNTDNAASEETVSHDSTNAIIEVVEPNDAQEPANKSSEPVNKPAETQKTVEHKKTTVSQKSDDASKTKTINKLLIPLQGDIIVDYAKDRMIYSKTLGDWRTHEGIDIKGTLGAQVKAAADGIVEKVYKDDALGITIIIDHGNSIKTKYSNLSTADMVKENQEVKKGDIISGVGETAAFEIGEEPHLHFEVLKEGKSVDPKTFLFN